jgi:hypothetical protein
MGRCMPTLTAPGRPSPPGSLPTSHPRCSGATTHSWCRAHNRLGRPSLLTCRSAGCEQSCEPAPVPVAGQDQPYLGSPPWATRNQRKSPRRPSTDASGRNPLLERPIFSLRVRGPTPSSRVFTGCRSLSTYASGFPTRPCSTQSLRWHFVDRNHPNGLLVKAVTSSLRINHDPNPLEHGAEDRAATVE